MLNRWFTASRAWFRNVTSTAGRFFSFDIDVDALVELVLNMALAFVFVALVHWMLS